MGQRSILAASLAAVGMLSCGPPASRDPADAAPIPPAIARALEAGAPQQVLLLLEDDRPAPDGLRAAALEPTEVRLARLDSKKADFFASASFARLPETTDYSHLPMLSMRVESLESLERIAAAEGVAAIFENQEYRMSLTSSLGVIDQAGAAALGALGQGTMVAVLDTGVDYGRAAFGSCAAPGNPGACAVTFAQDFAPSDGVPDDHGHGTNVAGIVLGVAPGARIAALDVFSGGVAMANHIIDAINWSVANQASRNIVAMNLSLGASIRNTAPCPGDVFAAPLASARAAGIVPVVAAGNDGWTDAVGTPACTPAAVSVGATYSRSFGARGWGLCADLTTARDQVVCFSNASPTLTLFAPGAVITAAGITMGGTSQASPHVAGAAAVLRGQFPAETVDQIVSRMLVGGDVITDARSGRTLPRLNVAAAIGSPADSGPPTGSVSINEGALTRLGRVTLTLSATDDVGVVQMCLSAAPTCSTWVAYATTATVDLPSGDGSKTVFASFRDARAQVSIPATASIVRDGTPPTNGAVLAQPGNGQVALEASGFADATSGVAGYRVVFAPNTPPASCATGTLLGTPVEPAFVHTGLANGTTYAYRVCAVDAAGNVSTGATVSARPLPETDPPVGTVSIDGGASFARGTLVTLTFAAADASGVTQLCVSEATTCSNWVAFAASRSFTLSAPVGTKVVRAWFRDRWGNTSATPATASILLDTVRPTDGAVEVARADGLLAFSWSGFADSGGSELASYRLVFAAGITPPSTCRTGTLAYAGSELAFAHGGLVNGRAYSYRLCAVDGAGNDSAGVTRTVIPAPELDPPTGTVAIEGGATWARAAAVTLNLSATDASGVAQVCSSNTASACTRWVAFAGTISHTLAAPTGTQTVWVWFRDVFGNTSAAPVSDDVMVDATAPTGGTLTVARASGENVLSFGGFSDAGGSGLVGHRVVFAIGGTAPASCRTGTQLYEGLDTAFTHTGLTNGTRYAYRVCALDGAGNLSSGVTGSAMPVPETDAPTGTVTVAAGAVATNSRNVAVAITATDASAVTSMCLSGDATCRTWVPFAASTTFTLPGSAGNATVNVWLRDQWGNAMASPVSDGILLDTTRPTDGSLNVTRGDGQLALAWSGATDSGGAGLTGYRLVVVTGRAAPATCRAGTLAYQGTETSFTHAGLTNGTAYSYRLCAVDGAGNEALGATVVATPAPELDPPTGSVSIDGGATWARSAAVTLNLSAVDASGVLEVCASNRSSACTRWVPFRASVAHTLAAPSGTQTVYVWFRDTFSNETVTPVSDTIDIDAEAPRGGTLSVSRGDTENQLSFGGFTDGGGSGLAGRRLVFAIGGTPPASCSAGSLLYEGTDGSFVHSGLTNGTRYAYRACAVDGAGNLSTGVTATAVPVPEVAAPTGTVTIEGGAASTSNRTLTLTIAASDASTVTSMCVSAAATCTQWVAFASPTTFAVASGSGPRTVNVWLRDEWGNAMTSPISDSILLDTARPSDGTFIVARGDTRLDLSFGGAADTGGSGLVGWRLVFAEGTTAPTTCRVGTLLYQGTDTAYAHTGLTNGLSYSYRLCAYDGAGNESLGLARTAIPAPELDAPTGTVVINADAAATRLSAVTLTLTGADASGVAEMCISNASSCTAWRAFNLSATHALNSGNGTKTVYVWLRDTFGNVTPTPLSDSIVFDATAPSGGTLVATAGPGVVNLAWSGFSDAGGSNLARYRVVYAAATAPPNCSGGVALYEGSDTSAVHGGATPGVAYGYRVCAIDGAGNVSTGVTRAATPQ
jgi:subtilisin family serine protease